MDRQQNNEEWQEVPAWRLSFRSLRAPGKVYHYFAFEPYLAPDGVQRWQEPAVVAIPANATIEGLGTVEPYIRYASGQALSLTSALLVGKAKAVSHIGQAVYA